MPIPVEILQRYHDVTLTVNVMYVNGICFINTIYHNIKLMTAEHFANSEASNLKNYIKPVKRIYTKRVLKLLTSLWTASLSLSTDNYPTYRLT